MKKILIVEDEKPMARALELKLNNSGFEATAVFNGEEALKTLAGKAYDLILLDLVMPIKDGFAVLEELNKSKKKTPVIILSNLNQDEDITKAKSLGAKDFFVKSDMPIADVVTLAKKILKIK